MVEAQILASWLTPTSLFVLLNIVVAAIYINHHSKTNNHHHHHNAAVSTTVSQPQLLRAPSLFSRVTSFNFSHYNYHHHSDDEHVHMYPDTAVSSTVTPAVATLARAPSLLHRMTSFNFGWAQQVVESEGKTVIKHEDDDVSREGKKVNKQKEKKEIPLQEEETSRAGHVRRESEEKVKKAVKKKKVVKKEVVAVGDVAKGEIKTTTFKKGDEEVDTKADDFINKFKQQLKLQRIESLLRYRNNNNA